MNRVSSPVTPASVMGHMLTAYHLDVRQLVLTHFCGAGNQHRMRVKAFDAGGRHIAFEMYDITNLANPEAYHSTRVEVIFLNDDRVDLVYHGTSAGKDTTQIPAGAQDFLTSFVAQREGHSSSVAAVYDRRLYRVALQAFVSRALIKPAVIDRRYRRQDARSTLSNTPVSAG